MSLFSSYLQEKTDKKILETEIGFATYYFPDSNTVYIEDIYVLPEHRNSRVASNMADQIAEIARQQGKTRMLGSVKPSNKDSTSSLKVLLGYGMALDSSTNDFILFSRSI